MHCRKVVALVLLWVAFDVAAQWTSVPDMEFLSSNFSNLKLIGAKELRDCVKEKRWCFYGDSTLEETIHDIVVLLSGGGSAKAREYLAYANGKGYHDHEFGLEQGVRIHFQNQGYHPFRRMRVEVPDIGFTLLHRFTGNRNITGNAEGVSALAYYLTVNWEDISSTCDIIVMNSGPHDWERGPTWTKEQYILHLHAMVEFLNSMIGGSNALKAFWKGSAWYALKEFFEFGGFFNTSFHEIVQSEYDVAEALDGSVVHFIDVSKVLSRFPLMTEKFKVSAKDPHIGQSGAKLSVEGSLLWTSVSTQTVLCTLCDNFPGFSFQEGQV